MPHGARKLQSESLPGQKLCHLDQQTELGAVDRTLPSCLSHRDRGPSRCIRASFAPTGWTPSGLPSLRTTLVAVSSWGDWRLLFDGTKLLYRLSVLSALRAFAFVVFGLFIWVAPGYGELAKSPPKYVVRWKMFSGIALDLFEVSFETVDARGQRKPVDRFALLGYPEPEKAPRNVRTLRTQAEVWALAKRMCAQMGGNAPLYARVRDATRAGWKTIQDGSADFCKARTWPAKSAVAEEREQGADS